MPKVSNQGVTIHYDVTGQGRPLMLLHGLWGGPEWWTEPGYVDQLRGDHRLVIVTFRGHGESDKPHDAAAYTGKTLVGDVFAIGDAEGLERFSIWGLSYGGWVAWMAAFGAPERIPAIVTSGAWDPRPLLETPTDTSEENEALRQGGPKALVDLFKVWNGGDFDREFPQWARDVTLRGDREAWIAANAPELMPEGLSDDDLASFPVPHLLITGEFDDPDDDAAKIAAMIPNGQTLRLPGLGHGGSCAASALTVPTARAFLDRWFAWPATVTSGTSKG
jgi:pimeloyl-ACP methyl ester carboxylesterase